MYYFGHLREKKEVTEKNDKFPKNHGNDDERGDYKLVMKDQILYRFEIVSRLVRGSFGQVRYESNMDRC